MNLKEITKQILSDYVVRLFKYWFLGSIVFCSWYLESFALPVNSLLIVFLLIKTKDLAYKEMKIDVEFGINFNSLRSFYVKRALTMSLYLVITGVVMSVVNTAEQMDIFYWFSVSSESDKLSPSYLYICFMRDAGMTLVFLGTFLGWVLFLAPIQPVLFQSDGDAYLAMEWYPVFYLFGGRDITLHFRDSFRSIDSKKDRIISEFDDYIKVVSGTDFLTLTLNTHVASERMWKIMKRKLSRHSGVESVEAKQKEKNAIMIASYIASIYLKIVAFQGKTYKEYRKLMDSQKLENNHECVVALKSLKECKAT